MKPLVALLLYISFSTVLATDVSITFSNFEFITSQPIYICDFTFPRLRPWRALYCTALSNPCASLPPPSKCNINLI